MKLKKKVKTKDGRFWFRCDQKQIDFCESKNIDLAESFRKHLSLVYKVAHDRKEKSKARKKSAVVSLPKRSSRVANKKKTAHKKKPSVEISLGQ